VPSTASAIFSGRVGIQEVNGIAIRQAKVVKPQFEWGFAPFPYGPGGKNTPQREDNAWYLGRGAKYPDVGFQLLLFASRQGATTEITIAGNNAPLADPSYFKKWASRYMQVPGFTMTEGDLTAVFEGALAAGFGDPGNIIANPLELINAFNQLTAPVWIGNETALTGLQSVQAKWQGIIASKRV
jgi:ABC-type glycerol-3-phosphate transport system substrate-binding protein